ncbi:MAG: hypothetical protein ACYCW6_19240 [Candidatus Xenobia bacterium]
MSKAIDAANRILKQTPVTRPADWDPSTVDAPVVDLLVGLKETPSDATAIRALIAEQKRALQEAATRSGHQASTEAGQDLALRCAMTGIMLGTVDGVLRTVATQAQGSAATLARAVGDEGLSAASAPPRDPLQTLEDQGVSFRWRHSRLGLFPTTDTINAHQAADLLEQGKTGEVDFQSASLGVPEWTSPTGTDELKEMGAFASRDFDHVSNPALARHLSALNVPVPYAAYRTLQQQKGGITVGNLTPGNAEEVHLLAWLQDKAPVEGLSDPALATTLKRLGEAGFSTPTDPLATWRQLRTSETPLSISFNKQVMGSFAPTDLRNTDRVLQNLAGRREAYEALGKTFGPADADALWPIAKGEHDAARLLSVADQKPAQHRSLYAEVLKATDEDWKAFAQDARVIASTNLNDAQQVAAWTELRKLPDADSRNRFKTLLPLVNDVPLTVRANALLGQASKESADERMKALQTLVQSGGAANGVATAEALAKADRLVADAPLLAQAGTQMSTTLGLWQQVASAKAWECLDKASPLPLAQRIGLLNVAKTLATVASEQSAAWEMLSAAKLTPETAQVAVNVARSIHPLESSGGFSINPSDASCWTDVINNQNHSHKGETLTSRPFEVPAEHDTHLQFQVYLNNANGQPCVEVSEDGKAWKKVADIAVNASWATQEVDLTPWSGKSVQFRVRDQGEMGNGNTGLYLKTFNLLQGNPRAAVAVGEFNRSVVLKHVLDLAGDDPKTSLPLLYQLSSKVPHLNRVQQMWSHARTHQIDGRFPAVSNALIGIFTRTDINPQEMLAALGDGDAATNLELYNTVGASVTSPSAKMAIYQAVRKAELDKAPVPLDPLLRTTSGVQSAGWAVTRANTGVLNWTTAQPSSTLSTSPLQIPAGASLRFQCWNAVGETGAAEISTDGGKAWKTLKVLPDSQNWAEVEVPLTAYANQSARFRITHQTPAGQSGNRMGLQDLRLETPREKLSVEDAARAAMAEKLLQMPSSLEALQKVAASCSSTDAAVAFWPLLGGLKQADRDALVALLTPRLAAAGADHLAQILGDRPGDGSLVQRYQQYVWAQEVAADNPQPVYRFINHTNLDQAGVQTLKALAAKPVNFNFGTWTVQNSNPQGRCWVDQKANGSDLTSAAFEVNAEHPPTLTFQTCMGAGTAPHVLEVSTNGKDWKPMDVSFVPGAWEDHQVDLKPYAGQSIQFRFRNSGLPGQTTNFWVGPLKVDGTAFETAVQGQRLSEIMGMAQASATPAESLRLLNAATDLDGLRNLLLQAPSAEDRNELLKLVAHQADLPTLHDVWSRVATLEPADRLQEMASVQRLTHLGGIPQAMQVWPLLLPLRGTAEYADTEAALTTLSKELGLDQALKVWSVLHVAGEGSASERATWYATARRLVTAAGMQQTMENDLTIYQQLRAAGLPVKAAPVLQQIMEQNTPRPPDAIAALLAASNPEGANEARRMSILESLRDLTKQTNLVQALQLWPALANVPPGPELEAKRTALGHLCASVGPDKALLTWKTLESNVKPTPSKAIPLRPAGSDQDDANRLARMKTLLDAGFHFKGPSQYPTAQDVCIGVGKGEAITFTLPGSTTEMPLLTCPDFDAEGMVALAKVRERCNKLLQGKQAPRQGSIELHRAQGIAGEYSDTTLTAYLRSMEGTPDSESVEALQRSFRDQIALLERGLVDLEKQARRASVQEMNAQTQFLADALGNET